MIGTIRFFGYRALTDPKIISSITGKPAASFIGKSAIIDGYTLVVQKMDQIPNKILGNAPIPKSPRQLL